MNLMESQSVQRGFAQQWKVRLNAALARGVDALVKWELGNLPMEVPDVDGFAPVDIEKFWAESRLHQEPPSVALGPVNFWRRHGQIQVRQLMAPSSGPGVHPGSRRLFATAYLRPEERGGAGDSFRRDTPAVLLIHGYAIPHPWWENWQCRQISRAGAHAIRMDQPFHLRRRIPGKLSGIGYLGPDLRRTRDSMRQATEDAATLVHWMRENVSDTVTVLGVSLGGLIALLLASHVELDGVVAVAPFCDPSISLLDYAPVHSRRFDGLTGGAWGDDIETVKEVLASALAPIIPKNFPNPVTPISRITLVRPEIDGIVGPGPISDLAETWGAEMWDVPHGHITVLHAKGLSDRIYERLLQPRHAEAESGAAAAARLAG